MTAVMDDLTIPLDLPGIDNTEENVGEKDDEAPYGRKSDGTPKAKPGPRGGSARMARRR